MAETKHTKEAAHTGKDDTLARRHDLLGDLFGRFFDKLDTLTGTESRGRWPMLDVIEQRDDVIVKAELPGVKAEDIDLTVRGNVLTVSGQKRPEVREEHTENYRHVERRSGSFYREVTLPTSVDADKIEASYDNGVLTVTLPKSAQSRPKKIPIREGVGDLL